MKTVNDYEFVSLEDYGPQQWTCVNCYCGLCVEGCPAYRELKNEVVSARGLTQVGLALISGEITSSDLTDEVLFACTGCRYCETVCAQNTPLFIQNNGNRKTKVSGATMTEIFRSTRIEEGGRIPKELRDALNNISTVGNPYGGGPKIKDDWVTNLGIKMNNKDTILYVGATVPFEDRSAKMAQAIVDVLIAGKIEFGMLGSEEKDSGAFSRMMGEEGLFFNMVEHNIKIFKEHKIKHIICVSPHDYDVFQHYYGNLEDIEITHYTQVLSDMIKNGKIKLSKKIKKKVTYHDPCYLGRRNNIYDEPRAILKHIPGLEFVEMERTRERAFCCGGGGTGLFFDLPDVNMDKTRANQVKEVHAECVAVACPNCYQMLDDAVKRLDYEIEVKDIAQLVLDAF